MQRRGNLAASGTGVAAFQQSTREFLDEKWHATGAFDDGGDGFIGEGLLRGDLRDDSADVASAQAVQVDLGVMRPQLPWRTELGACGVEQHQRRAVALLNQKLNQFQGRGVSPV